MINKTLKIISIILVAILLAGCWDYSEIKNKTIVAGISLDLTEDGRIRAGFELLPLPAGNDDKIEPAVLFAEGDTVEQAIFSLVEKISYAPYISHAWVIAISEQFAQRGIMPLVDLICAHPAFYMGSYIAVVKGAEAGEILSCKSISAPILSFEVFGSFEADAQFVSKTNAVYTYKLFSGKGDAVLPVVEIIQPQQSGGEGGEQTEELPPVVTNAGAAVFVDGKLAEFLTPDEVQAMRIFTGTVETTVLTPDRADLKAGGLLDDDGAATTDENTWAEELTYSVVSAKSALCADTTGSLPRFVLNVEIEAMARAIPEGAAGELCERMGRDKVTRMLREILQKSLETGHDFLGFLEHLRIYENETYRRLAADWSEVFAQLECEIVVKFKTDV